jgi:hypothetical protein
LSVPLLAGTGNVDLLNMDAALHRPDLVGDFYSRRAAFSQDQRRALKGSGK